MIIRCLIIVVCSILSDSLAAQYPSLKSIVTSREPANSSALSTGNWYKIKISGTGIYQLNYEDIKNMGFSNPADVRIFGNGGSMVPLLNAEPRHDDLIENSIYMNKGSDGIFNEGDYLLFYAQGPVSWSYNSLTSMFEHKVNQFSSASYYYVTTNAGTGKKISSRSQISGTPSLTVNSFDDYGYNEKSRYNLLKSGRQWFGEKISNMDFDTTFLFPGILTSSPVKIKINVASRSEDQKVFVLMNNSTVIGSISLPGINLGDYIGICAQQKTTIYNFYPQGDEVNLKLNYNNSKSTDEGYLDYLTINVRRRIILTNKAVVFRDMSVAGTNTVASYTVENCNSTTEIWDVTDPFNIRRMTAQLNGSIITFIDSTLYLKEYLAINPGATFPKPEITGSLNDIGPVANQNLHASSPHRMLIVTHPLFREAADSIAEFHREKDGMSVLVATTEEIYNEFSSGIPDVSAIRDFTRMLYNRSVDDDRLKYLLLLGDGSYNNLSRAAGNSNYIPTYQSEHSLNASYSYVSDDFYGFMEDTEGGTATMEKFSLDLGIGRLPAKTAEEALSLYRKIKNYNTSTTMSDWRNNILFAGDDEDFNRHMKQANTLADTIISKYPQFNVKKVLLDAYQQVSSSSGTSYPDVNRILNSNFDKGLLIFNYTGHGSESSLAVEHILTSESLQVLTNSNNLPLFVTATCEFSRFDDLTIVEGKLVEATSAGELSLVNRNGGSIALITTTRIVYSDENHELNTRFYEVAFSRDAEGKYRTLGDMIRITKNATGENRNKLNFILLGDPALKLAIPDYIVRTDSVNGVSVTEAVDTLKAFSRIRISGHLEDINSNLLSDFNGIVFPSVYDKVKSITTLANDDNGSPMMFDTQEDLLYKGKASIVNGRFSFEFMVPKDITYSYGNGKITYYSENLEIDANGYFSDFVIGGSNVSMVPDENGPEISLFLNDEYFNNEGITNPNPVIFAAISDESGINTIGNGIGHDITGVIDGKVAYPVVMNDYFVADLDDYTSGKLTYSMADLEVGWHSLRLKVWDVYNNSSEKTIEFRVLPGDRIVIANAGNYPNPASNQTNFIFEHNMPNEEIDIDISIFDMEGRLIANLSETILTAGYSSTPRSWDLRDLNGNLIRSGIYPYRIRITNKKGSWSDSYQKLVVIR